MIIASIIAMIIARIIVICYYLSYYPWEIEQNFNNSRSNSTNEILLLLRSPVYIYRNLVTKLVMHY